MSNEAHVVRVDGSERSKTISNDSEKSNEDIVDDIDNVISPTSNVDPTCSCQ